MRKPMIVMVATYLVVIFSCDTIKKMPGTSNQAQVDRIQERLDSLENAVYHDLPEINEMQESIIERQAEGEEKVERIDINMQELEAAAAGWVKGIEGLEYRFTQDSADTHDKMIIMAKEIGRLASGHRSNIDTTYIIDGGIEVQRINSDNFSWMFYHGFKDVKGKVEHKIDFEVGYQEYESLEDISRGIFKSVWQGFRTVTFSAADLQTFGEWSAEHGWRRAFQVNMYGLSPGKWYVFSTRATDEAGNQSAWLTSIDTMAVPYRFIIHRGR